MSKSAVILSMNVIRAGDAYVEYQRTLGRIDMNIEGLERIAEDVWLIPLPYGLPVLGQFVSACEFLSWGYRLMHIDHEAVWVNYGKDKRQVSEG